MNCLKQIMQLPALFAGWQLRTLCTIPNLVFICNKLHWLAEAAKFRQVRPTHPVNCTF